VAFQVGDRHSAPAVGRADHAGEDRFRGGVLGHQPGITLVPRRSSTKARSARLVVRTRIRCRTGTRWIASSASRSSVKQATAAAHRSRRVTSSTSRVDSPQAYISVTNRSSTSVAVQEARQARAASAVNLSAGSGVPQFLYHQPRYRLDQRRNESRLPMSAAGQQTLQFLTGDHGQPTAHCPPSSEDHNAAPPRRPGLTGRAPMQLDHRRHHIRRHTRPAGPATETGRRTFPLGTVGGGDQLGRRKRSATELPCIQ
jgi:hypothetical protein